MNFIFAIFEKISSRFFSKILGNNTKTSIINIILGLLSVLLIFLGLKYYFTKDQKIIEKQKNEINNLKIEKHIQKDTFIKKEFELNQSNKVDNAKQKIKDLDKQQHIKTADSIESNKTKININTIKDIEKLKELKRGKEYIIEIN